MSDKDPGDRLSKPRPFSASLVEGTDQNDRLPQLLPEVSSYPQGGDRRISDVADTLSHTTFTVNGRERTSTVSDLRGGDRSSQPRPLSASMTEMASRTIMEEDVPVSMRRRGCTLRVRITSYVDDSDFSFRVGIPNIEYRTNHFTLYVCMQYI